MTEKSAAAILLAQIDYEVAEAKAAVFREFQAAGVPVVPSTVDALESLANTCIARWWVGRAGSDGAVKDPAAIQERMQTRSNVLARCVQLMIERSGPIDANALQMSTLGISADVNALWGALIEIGIFTPAIRQEYLDQAVANTYQRVVDHTQKIQLAQSVGRRQ